MTFAYKAYSKNRYEQIAAMLQAIKKKCGMYLERITQDLKQLLLT